MTLGALLPATPGHTQVARQAVRVLQNGPPDTVPVSVQGISLTPGGVLPVRNVNEPALAREIVIIHHPPRAPLAGARRGRCIEVCCIPVQPAARPLLYRLLLQPPLQRPAALPDAHAVEGATVFDPDLGEASPSAALVFLGAQF